MARSKAQRAAESRYDEKRAAPLTGRLSLKQAAWLDERRKPGEGRFPALKRLSGMPKI